MPASGSSSSSVLVGEDFELDHRCGRSNVSENSRSWFASNSCFRTNVWPFENLFRKASDIALASADLKLRGDEEKLRGLTDRKPERIAEVAQRAQRRYVAIVSRQVAADAECPKSTLQWPRSQPLMFV